MITSASKGFVPIINILLAKPDEVVIDILNNLIKQSKLQDSECYAVLGIGIGKDRKFYVWNTDELQNTPPELSGEKITDLPDLKLAEVPHKFNLELESINEAWDILEKYWKKYGAKRLIILDEKGEVEGLLPQKTKGFESTTYQKAEATATTDTSGAKPARFLNACLTDAKHDQVIKPSDNLAVNAGYALRVNIGPLSSESAVVDPGIFPDDDLPRSSEGWWLEAMVVSDDFKVEKKRYPFFLPLHGPSWVCACRPGEPHHCNAMERKDHLYIPLQTPLIPGCKTLRLTIYFRKNAVESLLLTAHVFQALQTGGGYRLDTDFRLTARLDSVDFLPERSANILVNQNLNGTHCLVINGPTAEPLYFSLGDDAMRKATNTLRIQLEKIHYKKSGILGHSSNYDQNNAKPKEGFIKDLITLAEKGWELYDLISNKIDLSVDEPGTIQIAQAATEFVFPWAFIYDIEKESFAAWEPCQLLQTWDGKTRLVPEGTRRCPHEQEHTKNTLCPFGFWGYRHILELPASINRDNTDKIRQVIHKPGQLDFIFIHNTTLDQKITSRHIDALRKSLGNTWNPITKRQEAKNALDNPDPEIIYFYVHGKKLEEDSLAPTSLLVGNDEEIMTKDIKAWYKSEWKENPNHWHKSSPLIFINGCHTANLIPDSPVSFVEEFSRAAAAGVVGTEITISQRVASEMAESFLAYFVKQTPAGEALRLARLNLLNKGNLLGLVYAAYCAADLALD